MWVLENIGAMVLEDLGAMVFFLRDQGGRKSRWVF